MQYLLEREFVIRTDHAALTWLQRTPDIIGQQARWHERLPEFNFKIYHRPTTRHGINTADAAPPTEMSRDAVRFVQDVLKRPGQGS